MASFDPRADCRTFHPDGAPDRRRSSLLFVESCGERFVVKSAARPGLALSDAAGEARREAACSAAWTASGLPALPLRFGPCERLALRVDGVAVEVPWALVHPFHEGPTLADALRGAGDPEALVAEAARRIAARHRAASSLALVHSDGAANNVFADWVWFDFAQPWRSEDVDTAKAWEVVAFLQSLVPLLTRRAFRASVRAFRTAYADPARIQAATALVAEHPTRPRAAAIWKVVRRLNELPLLWRDRPRKMISLQVWLALRATREEPTYFLRK